MLLNDLVQGTYGVQGKHTAMSVMETYADTLSIFRCKFLRPCGPERQAAWGDDVYRESGSTAIIRIDGFLPDEEDWDSYHAGIGELPNDAVGITLHGLKRAVSNPDIRNILFDLSFNAGGRSDLLAFILALTTGQDHTTALKN